MFNLKYSNCSESSLNSTVHLSKQEVSSQEGAAAACSHPACGFLARGAHRMELQLPLGDVTWAPLELGLLRDWEWIGVRMIGGRRAPTECREERGRGRLSVWDWSGRLIFGRLSRTKIHRQCMRYRARTGAGIRPWASGYAARRWEKTKRIGRNMSPCITISYVK